MEAAGKVPSRRTETAYEGGTERTRLVPPSGSNPWETASASINVDFPEHYGDNWDAFWDCLSIDSPVEYVRIVGESTMPEDLKKHLSIMHEILDRCKRQRTSWGLFFGYEIVD